MSVFLQSDAG